MPLKATSNLEKIRQNFREYAELNKRDVEQLALDQARKLATDLYVETAAVAPTRAEIDADVRKQGWKIPKYFNFEGIRGWRVSRGVKALWAGTSLARRAKRIEKRGRRSKADRMSDSQYLASKPTLAQMQAFVIKLRMAAARYLATGWLGAISDLGGSNSGPVDKSRGGATVQRSAHEIKVTMWNATTAIVAENEKKGFVEKALGKRAADIAAYIARKKADAAKLLSRGK